MKKNYLEIGKIVSTHGVRGEVRVQPWCNSPEFMKGFDTLYLSERGGASVRVLSARPHGNVVIMKIEGVDTITDAEAMRGTVLHLRREDAKLRDGDWFIEELIGCRVFDADDSSVCYGELCAVSSTGANDVWHIRVPDGNEVLIPAIRDVVVKVDVESGVILIRPLRGLFDDN